MGIELSEIQSYTEMRKHRLFAVTDGSDGNRVVMKLRRRRDNLLAVVGCEQAAYTDYDVYCDIYAPGSTRTLYAV